MIAEAQLEVIDKISKIIIEIFWTFSFGIWEIQCTCPLLPYPLWYLRSGHLPEIRGRFPEAAFKRCVPSIPGLKPKSRKMYLSTFALSSLVFEIRTFADVFLRRHLGDPSCSSWADRPKFLTMYLSLFALSSLVFKIYPDYYQAE